MKNRLFAFLILAVLTFSVGFRVTISAAGPHPPHRECAMSDESFARLLQLIDEESFDSGKLRIIEAATLGGYFSCDQVATILSKISFSSEKKKVIQMMANSIVGFRGLDHVLEQINFDSDKREVLEILGIPYFRF